MVNTSSPQFVAKVRKYILSDYGGNVIRFGRQVDYSTDGKYGRNPSETIHNIVQYKAYEGFGPSPYDMMELWGFRGDAVEDDDRFIRIVTRVANQLYKEYLKKDPYSSPGTDKVIMDGDTIAYYRNLAIDNLNRRKSVKRVAIFSNPRSLKPRAVITRTAKGYLYKDSSKQGYLDKNGRLI